MPNCCTHTKQDSYCLRKRDKKRFNLPRRFSRKACKKPRGFTMRSSCAPYKGCSSYTRNKRQKKTTEKKEMNLYLIR